MFQSVFVLFCDEDGSLPVTIISPPITYREKRQKVHHLLDIPICALIILHHFQMARIKLPTEFEQYFNISDMQEFRKSMKNEKVVMEDYLGEYGLLQRLEEQQKSIEEQQKSNKEQQKSNKEQQKSIKELQDSVTNLLEK